MLKDIFLLENYKKKKRCGFQFQKICKTEGFAVNFSILSKNSDFGKIVLQNVFSSSDTFFFNSKSK